MRYHASNRYQPNYTAQFPAATATYPTGLLRQGGMGINPRFIVDVTAKVQAVDAFKSTTMNIDAFSRAEVHGQESLTIFISFKPDSSFQGNREFWESQGRVAFDVHDPEGSLSGIESRIATFITRSEFAVRAGKVLGNNMVQSIGSWWGDQMGLAVREGIGVMK